MFRKQFKIKSNTQLKTSERKVLKESFLRSFPLLKEDDVDSILPKKEVAFCLKILTSSNMNVIVYIVQRRTIAFELNGTLFPSVYLLWKYNDLILNFTTNSFVISKIMNGADLMLPGVIKNPNGYGVFPEKHLASINSNTNKAPIAVGITDISSHDLNSSQSKGKCIIVYHFHGDKLCSLEDMPVLPIPNLGPPEWLIYSIQDMNDFPPLGEDIVNNVGSVEVPETSAQAESEPVIENIELNETAQMDQILTNSFLTAIKYSKTLHLPVLTSSFYKLEIMPLCTSDKHFDIKKTSFKKLGQFLKYMEKEGVIVIKEKKKGVETIEMINYEHPLLLNFYLNADSRPKKSEQNVDDTAGPTIVESYSVTNAVLPIFSEFGFKKGDTLQLSKIREFITMYVKNHNCQNKENQKLVDINDALKIVCKNENTVCWEELIDKVCSAMKSSYKVTCGYEEMVSKGKLQPIIMSVQTRSGNKKVTLIDNLELYGIRMSEFAKECQHGVAASTSITKSPGKNGDQLLVQGNQILFVYNLLIDKYKIPKKYIKGLENAPKTKK